MSSSDKQILEIMQRISRDGLTIGVLFDDPLLNQLRGLYQLRYEEAKKQRAQEFINSSEGILWSYKTPEDYAKVRAFGDALKEREESFKRAFTLEEEVTKNFFSFINEKNSPAYSSHPRGSRFDIILHAETDIALEYLKKARVKFPTYKFVTGENLNEDSTENPIARGIVRIV